MRAIMDIAARHGLSVVEDNAHGLFGRYREAPLGSFGALSTLSFHETKNISCGEGGALLINDASFAERAEIIREKGTNRSRFFRGLVDKYTWVDVGSSYLPSELLAACLLAQLESSDLIQARRRGVWEFYRDELSGWAAETGTRLPSIPAHCSQSYHMFYLLLPDLGRRDALIAHLRSRGILAVFHYLPLHLSEMGRRFGGRPGDCPVTEDVSDRLVRLPFYADLAREDCVRVVEAIRAWT
jgi:dTDP-4-amino-4,6-dideoxygalactose transaminase